MKRLCVFCGSAVGNNPDYANAAKDFGDLMLEQNLGLVFGGGHIGLMGVLADAILAGDGHVIGVIPQALKDKELAHEKVQDMRIVATMHERKALMADLSDGFVALPGGFGTADELLEILTWRQLKIHRKPIGLLNVSGFFNNMLHWLDHMVGEGFVKPDNRELIIESDSPQELLSLLSKRS